MTADRDVLLRECCEFTERSLHKFDPASMTPEIVLDKEKFSQFVDALDDADRAWQVDARALIRKINAALSAPQLTPEQVKEACAEKCDRLSSKEMIITHLPQIEQPLLVATIIQELAYAIRSFDISIIATPQESVFSHGAGFALGPIATPVGVAPTNESTHRIGSRNNRDPHETSKDRR